AQSGSIAGLCRASTMARSTPSSFPTAAGAPTSWSISAMPTRPARCRAIRAWPSTTPAGSCSRAGLVTSAGGALGRFRVEVAQRDVDRFFEQGGIAAAPGQGERELDEKEFAMRAGGVDRLGNAVVGVLEAGGSQRSGFHRAAS